MASPESYRALRSNAHPVSRSTRHARPKRTYRESSSEDEGYDDEVGTDGSDDVPLARKRPQRQRRPSIPQSPQHVAKRPRSSTSSSIRRLAATTTPKRQRASTPSREKQNIQRRSPKVVLKLQAPIVSSGIIPPWSTLPYQILVQIFHYASFPLYDEKTFRSNSVSWLLKTSRVCRAFAEPALTVLYRNPCLLPMERAHRLVTLLKSDPEPMSFNYRQKIEHIAMEVAQTAAYSLSGSGLLDIHGLVHNCPRLRDLEIYHQKDMSPYRDLDVGIKWTYPEALFSALDNNVDGLPTKLRSWRWSSRMAGKRWPLEKLVVVHTSPSFVGLKKIAFVNYQMPAKRKEGVVQPETLMAQALAVLPNLDTLIFESSTILNQKLLPDLPKGLRHIEFINCWEVTSEDMAAFLQTHGSQLRSLTLHHNQSLSLSFLEILAAACPHLIALKMNLTYYNLHSTYRDSQPLYTALLLESEIPTWPSTLQTIELIQLRNWDIPTAESFFQSLVRNCHKLVDLRRLVIKAILSESWRERMVFRDKWVDRFERVFKRQSADPDPHLRSIAAYKAYKKQANGNQRHQLRDEDNDPISSDLALRNTSQRPTSGEAQPSSAVFASSKPTGSAASNPPPRRLTRAGTGVLQSKTIIESSSESEEDKEGSDFEDIKSNTEESPAKRRINRELEILKRTAGFHAPKDLDTTSSGSPGKYSETDSDDEPLVKRSSKGKRVERIQGMCDVVDIRIDNLRPTETQFEEADFLDSEPEGDEDWNEGAELAEDQRYAW